MRAEGSEERFVDGSSGSGGREERKRGGRGRLEVSVFSHV